MTSDILKRAAEAVAMPLIGAWNICKFQEISRTLIPDMAAAIAERDVEIDRLTARAEAAEAREGALLAANDVNRKLMLDRNAELARWKKMADRLVFDLNKAREWDWISFEEMRNAENGELVAEECLPTLCALDRSIGADLATYAAMKEGR